MANVWSSAKILEFDFSGIEAVLMGWFMRAPNYIRLAKLGLHAYLASHVLQRPADLTWDDPTLAAYFKAIKKSSLQPEIDAYERSKRVVHGTAYGLTPHGMVRNFPKTFPTLKVAEALQRVYFNVAPEVSTFHAVVRQTAHDTRKLGGAEAYDYRPEERRVIGHPYGYLHWFWSVVSYTRLKESQVIWRRKRREPFVEFNGIAYTETLGEDAKRAVAFYPQGTARGVLTEACFPLFDPDDPLADSTYIGDFYYGETPLRAPIHDSLLLECPTRKVDQLIERVARAMMAPVLALPCPPAWSLGAHLTIGVDAKMGDDWGAMSPIPLPSLTDLGVANDVPYTPAEVADEEDVEALEVSLGEHAPQRLSGP